MRDIDHIRDVLRATRPDILVEQLTVTHAADDDGLWFFRRDGAPVVQLESSTGDAPFLIESDGHDDRRIAATRDEALALVLEELGVAP